MATKVYLLNHSSWEILKSKIEFNSNCEYLERNIAVYELNLSPEINSTAIISTAKEVDKILEEEGATENNDLFKKSFSEQNHNLLYGAENLKNYL